MSKLPQASEYDPLNKFAGWVRQEGLKVEIPEAMNEFLPDPRTIPPESREAVSMLFEDWFVWERRLIRQGVSPLELFLRVHERILDEREIEIYRRFGSEGSLGFFKIESVCVSPSREMRLKRVTDEKIFHVTGSLQGAQGGEMLIARLIPFEDHWIVAGVVALFPGEALYHVERTCAELRGKGNMELKPWHFLNFLLPKINWQEQGLFRVKARISMILQRWKADDLTVSLLEKDILEAHSHKASYQSVFSRVVSRAPCQDDARELTKLLFAFWNLTHPDGSRDRGPKEKTLLKDLIHAVALEDKTIENEAAAKEAAAAVTARWLDEPQKELNGRTPREVILEERRAMENPRVDLDYCVTRDQFEIGGQVNEGARLLNQAAEFLNAGNKPEQALELLQKACPLMKGHPDNFLVFGHMTTAFVMLGRREEALAAARAALKANPDYDMARSNLHFLESMTPQEFERRHKAGTLVE